MCVISRWVWHIGAPPQWQWSRGHLVCIIHESQGCLVGTRLQHSSRIMGCWCWLLCHQHHSVTAAPSAHCMHRSTDTVMCDHSQTQTQNNWLPLVEDLLFLLRWSVLYRILVRCVELWLSQFWNLSQDFINIAVNMLSLKWNSRQNATSAFFYEWIWVKPSCKSITTMNEALLRFTVVSFSGQNNFQCYRHFYDSIKIFLNH